MKVYEALCTAAEKSGDDVPYVWVLRDSWKTIVCSGLGL